MFNLNKKASKKASKNKVFLGGTCNESLWREDLIEMLEIDYFNPVVKDWTPECQEEEKRQKGICHYRLYVITPRMTGVFSIAEVVDDSNKFPEKTVFCIHKENGDKDFDEGSKKSLDAVCEMVEDNGATVCKNLKEVAEFLNS